MRERIKEILLAAGVAEAQAEALCDYAEFLAGENEKYNLTALTAPEDVAVKHFLDSLLPLEFGLPPEGASVIDVGSGAGLPAIPLAVARPDLAVTALDATEKKVAFIAQAARIAGAKVTAIAARAEEAAKPPLRESFDVAVSRGVAALNALCELCLPFVKVGGAFIAYKGRGADEEIAEAKNAVAVLGGKLERVERAPIGDAERALVVIRKVKPTPAAYPRPFARIKKKPL